MKFLDIHTENLGEVNKNFEVLTLRKNNEYVEKGFPIGYDNKDFGTSETFLKLKQNIIKFFKNILPD